jgi:hypothetical protein
MLGRIIPLLLLLSFINAQIALPTFQAVHTPHTAEAESGSQTFSYTGAVQTYTAPSSGSYQIEVWGAQGGYSTGEFTLTAGQTITIYVGGQGAEKPTVTITFPQNNSSVSKMVSITCISSDNEVVEKVELWVNGVTTEITDDSELYSFDWNTTLVDNGNYTITVRSYDTNDNTTDSEPIVLTVDNTQSNPQPINITSVVFDNNGFNITWSQNNDNDFQSYTLYESQSEDMSGQNEVFTSENNSDTSYTVTGVNEDEERYYQVVVEDVWGYQSLNNIEIGDLHNWFVQTFGRFEPDYGYPVLNFTIFPQL